ncbi:hypothetical protein [Hymenobacter sediminicola]|nr:hypothetical protein [Hymenobacter sediminicola]
MNKSLPDGRLPERVRGVYGKSLELDTFGEYIFLGFVHYST